MRQVVLDTETTGLEVAQGHRIIELGCVEVINRRLTGRRFHQYVNPEREIDPGAIEVHGISNEFLDDKPPFLRVAEAFLDFIEGAQLIIHNAPFDIGFLDGELRRMNEEDPGIEARCPVIDTLLMARDRHPGQRNSLDSLCQRYHVDNSSRELHGALLDAEILADVYLAMTGGQTTFELEADTRGGQGVRADAQRRRLAADRLPLPVIEPSTGELSAHEAALDAIAASNGGTVVWRQP